MSNGLPRLKSIKATRIFVENCVFVCFLFSQSKIQFLFFVLFSQEMRYEVMVMLFLLVFFCFDLMINNSPSSFTNDGTLPQMKINLKISKHGKVKSEDGETSVGTSAADRHCTRKTTWFILKLTKLDPPQQQVSSGGTCLTLHLIISVQFLFLFHVIFAKKNYTKRIS